MYLRHPRGGNGLIPSRKIILVIFLAASAMAQHWVAVRAGMINHAEGDFYIDQEIQQFPQARFRQIPQGKSLRTGKGWVELNLGPNAFLWIGEEGVLRIEDPSLTNIQLLIERGSAVFEVFEQNKGSKFRVRFGEAVIEPRQPGLYRLDSEISQLSVYAGKAEIRLAGKEKIVKKGKAAILDSDMKTSRFDVHKIDRLQEIAARRSQLLNSAIQEALMSRAPRQVTLPRRGYEELEEQRQRELIERAKRAREAQLNGAIDSTPSIGQ